MGYKGRYVLKQFMGNFSLFWQLFANNLVVPDIDKNNISLAADEGIYLMGVCFRKRTTNINFYCTDT